MKLKKNIHKKIKGKKIDSTRVNLTNPLYTTWVWDKKNRSPKKDLTKKAQVKLKNTVNENARWHGLAWPIHSQNNKT
jgi:hypothetical protein